MASILGDPEALIAEVSRRAHQRAVEIAEDTRRRSNAILEGAKQESEAIRRQAAQDADRQAAAVERGNAARAELEAKRRFIEMREEPIELVWRESEERLRGVIKEPAYLDILKRLALRAAHDLGAGELTLAADPIGHTLLSDELLEHWSKDGGVQFRRADQPADIWGGLIATSGRVRFDLSFDTRLESARRALRERVFEVLSKESS